MSRVMIFALFVGGVVLVAALSGTPNSDSGASSGPDVVLVSDEPQSIVSYTIGCKKTDDLGRLGELIRQHDDAALNALFGRMVIAGECIGLDAGTSVYVTDTSAWHQMAKVRPSGETDEYWTPWAAFEKKAGK